MQKFRKKYLVAVAAAGLLAGPLVASASAADTAKSVMTDYNIKFFAHLHGSLDYSNTGGPDAPNSTLYGESAGSSAHAFNLSNNNSYVGFSGQHLVPGAFMAIFQVELSLPGSQSGVNASYNRGNHVSKNIGMENTYFGIANPLGTLLFEPTFQSQGAYLSRPFNIFKDTVGDFNSIIDTINFPNGGPTPNYFGNAQLKPLAQGLRTPALSFAGQSNYAIAYVSPKFHGFDMVVAYTEDANGGDFGTANTYGVGYEAGSGSAFGFPNANQHNNAYSAGLQYENEFPTLHSKFQALINYSDIHIQGDTLLQTEVAVAPSGGGQVQNTIVNLPVQYASANGPSMLPPSNKLNLRALELAGKYTYEPTGTTGIAVWERSTGLYTRNAFSIGLSQALPGHNTLMASYIHAGSYSSPLSNCAFNGTGYFCSGGKVSNSGADEYVAGLQHNFDKAISMYLIYAYTHNQANGLYGVGSPNHGQSTYPTAPGAHPQSISLGMTWDF